VPVLRRIAGASALSLLVMLLASSETLAGVRLSDPIESPVAQGWAGAVALADLDRDGILDAVVAGKTLAVYGAYHGSGDGSFSPSMASGSLYKEPRDLVLGDFDGDGRPDLAAINSACT
jgi:hypothetical protein